MPTIIFQSTYFSFAALYDLAGDTAKREEFSRLLQQARQEFKPDQIDSIFSDAVENLRKLRDDMRSEIPSTVREAFDQMTARELYQSGFMKFA